MADFILIDGDTAVFMPAFTPATVIVQPGKLEGSGPATIDVKSFKDAFNVSRKYAIPLLEYLDRERVTRRAGDARIVL